jgi:hypothetical protein
MTIQLSAETLTGIANALAFSRMTDEQKNRHLKDLEIRNIQDEVKWYNNSIAYSRKKIAELQELAGGVMTPSDIYHLEQDEKELNLKIGRRAELKAKIKQLRK